MNSRKLSLYSQEVNPRKLELLNEYLGSGSILDIGCGNGLYGLYLAQRGHDVLQVDIEDRRLPAAREIPFSRMDAQELNLQGRHFDYLLAFDLIEHLADDSAFLGLAWRLCRRGIFLSVPNEEDQQAAMLLLTHIHHKDKTHYRAYCKHQIEERISASGFKIVALRGNYNSTLMNFAFAFAQDRPLAKLLAGLISVECKLLERLGLFENRCIGDWFCYAEKTPLEENTS